MVIKNVIILQAKTDNGEEIGIMRKKHQNQSLLHQNYLFFQVDTVTTDKTQINLNQKEQKTKMLVTQSHFGREIETKTDKMP